MEKSREEFALAAKGTNNFSALCREFGISRQTGYKWVARYDDGLPLSNQSRRPQTVANKTPAETEKLILELRRSNPGWGAKTIKQVLENKGHTDIPCAKTVNNILSRNGCIAEEESLKRVPFKRFEKSKCNIMWQTDFKGEFKTADNLYCYPLTILDDCSRFSIKIAPHLSTKNVVIPSFQAAFQEFGLPETVLSDNGSQFAGFRHGYTQFEKWLMNQNVLPIHGRISHPQTQGKIERFHGTMKRELLNHVVFENINDADYNLQRWRYKYNHIRPHEALGMKCPADVYEASERKYSNKIKPFEYGGQYHVIKVNSWGYVRFDKW